MAFQPKKQVMNQTNRDITPGFVKWVVLAFFFLGLLLMVSHEMWCDEMQAWLIARDSNSLGELFQNLRYEGHPGLWHSALYLLSRFTTQPLAMQLFHLVLASGAVYIFLKYSPFTKLQKILFVFGYFPFFEYAAISRNYAMGVLLIFGFCALRKTALAKKYLLISCTLFLLSQTNIYALIIAMSLGAALILEFFLEKNLRPLLAVQRGELIFSLLIFLLGILVAIVQIVPPVDSGFAVGWHGDFDFGRLTRTISTIWRSYVPLPLLQYNFWDTNIITHPYLQFYLSGLLMVFALALFARKPLILFLYMAGTLGIFLFTYTKYPGSLRHHGHLFILLIACLWLANFFPDRKISSAWVDKLSGFAQRHRDKFILLILAAQLVAGILASSLDLCLPFSGSKEMAKFITDNQMDKMVMVGDEDDAASAVAGYLNGKMYYPCSERCGSFVIWDQSRKSLNQKELVKRAEEIMKLEGKDILLILNYEIKDPAVPLVMLKKSEQSIVPTENFYLYLMPHFPRRVE